MRKALVAVLMLAILVVGLKYYHDTNHGIGTNTENPINNTGHTGDGFGGPSSPVIVPPNVPLGIYWNSNASDPVTEVNWTTLYPGQNNSFTFYLRNEGDSNLRPTLSTSNWVIKDANGTVLGEEYRDYFSVTWNYNNTDIGSNQILAVTVTLSISPLLNEDMTYEFDITIG